MADCVYHKCPGCDGSGIQTVIIDGTGNNPVSGDITCQQCNGEKLVLWGDIVGEDVEGSTDIMDKCNDILDKCADILEKCNEILASS